MSRIRLALPVVWLFLACCGESEAGLSAAAERGRQLYEEKGCVGCHTTDGTTQVGPSWAGLYGSQVRLADGSTVQADEGYLRESILQPSAKTVEGFQPGVMESVIEPNSLTDEEVEALVAYIKELR